MSKIPMLKSRMTELDLRTARELPRVTDPIYSSSPWLGLMAKLKRLRSAKCERCGRTDGKIYGDHIHELKDGGAPYDEANIRLLCAPCHGKKTAGRRAERLRGPLTRPAVQANHLRE